MPPLYLAFLWHMHQPFYKNLFTGEYLLPWVLLHGTKDYCDMALLLKEFQGMKQNFNLVPSLLVQFSDYEKGNVKDRYIDVFRKEPRQLTKDDKIFLLVNFFSANWDNMIRPYPRYYELLKKRGFYYPKEGISGIINYFSDDDFRDIQVFFFLTWIDPVFIDEYEGLRHIISKGRGFNESDKATIENAQKEILRNIVPLYKELASAGSMEISTSPFYHPIIPLLIESASAREAMPKVDLPEPPFSRPQDAAHQIEGAVGLFRDLFGQTPRGMWPPEGSVSDRALQLYMDNGIEWLATDEDILFESLRIELRRDGSGYLSDPEILYRPYRYEKNGQQINLVFRDKNLSDLISFHYSRMAPREAAEDCIARLKCIGDSVSRKGVAMPLVTIAMDGENAWESYKNDGRDFLQFLYEGILREKNIVPVTISEYLAEAKDYGSIQHCFAGSWIAHNFSIWIGHIEDNTGWSLLSVTREYLEKKDPERTNKEAWESIYIAEGSDWFWWYGDEHSSEQDEVFDYLFRENLANVYRFMGEEPPDILSIPILLEDREIRPTREPINLLYPVIDGEVTNYFDWMGAGFLEGKGAGMAMHEGSHLIKGLYYGFNEHSFFVRIDIGRSFISNVEDISFEISLMMRETYKIVYRVKGKVIESPLKVKIGFSDILEVEIPFEVLGAKKGDKIAVWASLKMNDMVVDRIPKRGYLTVPTPSENFEAEMWYV
jgi:alpha-amylase/alpha-mannosidase (GH57 family)